MTKAPLQRRFLTFVILTGLLVLAAAGAGFYFFMQGTGKPGQAAALAGPRSAAITLCFYPSAGPQNVTRKFLLPEHLAFPEQIRAIVEKMSEKNPDPAATFWPEVLRLRNVFLRSRGLLIVDLEPGVTYNHTSAAAEWRIVRSLAATLLANYPDVRQVKFLVNGMEQDTLSGHVALSWPFSSQELEP